MSEMKKVLKFPSQHPRVDNLYNGLLETIYEKGDGLTYAEVLGVVEIIKHNLIEDANEEKNT